ncbi:hypothetical protein BD413DRAFT_228894 [Trametes elegans]|nr:hypothetical protein BD413DRAFT_228894 [Trametes elegans]
MTTPRAQPSGGERSSRGLKTHGPWSADLPPRPPRTIHFLSSDSRTEPYYVRLLHANALHRTSTHRAVSVIELFPHRLRSQRVMTCPTLTLRLPRRRWYRLLPLWFRLGRLRVSHLLFVPTYVQPSESDACSPSARIARSGLVLQTTSAQIHPHTLPVLDVVLSRSQGLGSN